MPRHPIRRLTEFEQPSHLPERQCVVVRLAAKLAHVLLEDLEHRRPTRQIALDLFDQVVPFGALEASQRGELGALHATRRRWLERREPDPVHHRAWQRDLELFALGRVLARGVAARVEQLAVQRFHGHVHVRRLLEQIAKAALVVGDAEATLGVAQHLPQWVVEQRISIEGADGHSGYSAARLVLDHPTDNLVVHPLLPRAIARDVRTMIESWPCLGPPATTPQCLSCRSFPIVGPRATRDSMPR